MNNKSTYLQEKLINYILGNEEFTPPNNFYLALFHTPFTIDPVTNDLNNEISTVDTGYYRVEYPNDSSSWSGTNGTRYNTNEIAFPQAISYWGFVKAWIIMDVSSGGNANNFYYWGNLPDPGKLIDYGDILKWDANRLKIIEN